jgi:hypothetical protein
MSASAGCGHAVAIGYVREGFFSADRQRVIDIAALRASHSHPKEEVTSIANCDRNHALHELFLKHPLRWLALQV